MSIPSFIGFLLAAIGLLFSSLTITASGVILIAIYVLGILSGFALAYAGYCRLRGEPTNCLLFAVIAAYMIFRTLAACQTWSSEVQVQYYVFPLLANLTLLLAAFYRAAIGADMGNCRRYLLFRNVAVFCCMLSIVSGDWLFFLAGAVWMITDFCDPFLYGKYAV